MKDFAEMLEGNGWKGLVHAKRNLKLNVIYVTDIYGNDLKCKIDEKGDLFRFENGAFDAPMGYELIDNWEAVYIGNKNPFEVVNSAQGLIHLTS
jgi:hypothetical protein